MVIGVSRVPVCDINRRLGGESDREILMVPACVILSLVLWQKKKMKSLDPFLTAQNSDAFSVASSCDGVSG